MGHVNFSKAAAGGVLALCIGILGACTIPFNIGTHLSQGQSESGHNIGINLFAAQLDFDEDRLFADAMKTAREWVVPGSYGGGTPVATDANGWPTVDAETIVFNGLLNMNGTYYLEGESKSQPTVTPGFGKATLQNFTYNSGDGHFSAKIVYTSTDRSGLLLTFRNTGGGVRNVKLMRPRSVGSSSSYSTSTMFTDQAKALVEKFKVIRFMWAVDAWNGAWQTSWNDRVKPDYCSYNRGADTIVNGVTIGWAGKGMPWEAAIQFCNETGKDMWLNMPLGADDEYIRQLATLVKNTYTVPEGKVYWEYSNEATWDMLGVCSSYLRSKAQAEVSSGGPVGYDMTTVTDEDVNVVTARYYVKRAAEMSAIWRSVWGDQAMMTRVRPIASGQLSYDAVLIWGLEFIHNWFNNGDGNHVAEPHPVNYYFYGCGASNYTGSPGNPGDDPDQLTDDGVTQIARMEAYEEEEVGLAKIYGLERCAYEGGVWTSAANYELPRIEDAMVRYHALWDKYGCDLLVYYVSTGGEDDGKALGFTTNAFDLDTRKFRALDTILSQPKPEASAGKLAPCIIQGADFSISSVPWSHPAPSGAETAGATELNQWATWRGYIFRISKRGTYSIQLHFNLTSGAALEVMVDGAVIANETCSGTSSPVFSVTLDKGLHGIRVRRLDNSGSFFLNSVQIN